MICRIKNSSWSKCAPKVKDRLRSLTLTDEESAFGGSIMRQKIKAAEEGQIDPEIFTLQTPLIYNAWAMVCENSWYGQHNPYAMFYVRPDLRRQKLGSKLLEKIKTKYPNITCRPWDRRSKMFFVYHNINTMKDKHPSELQY